MKTLQMVGAVVVVAVAGGLFYQFVISSSVHQQVRETASRVDEQEKEIEKHDTRLGDHEERVREVEKKIREHENELAVLKPRIAELDTQVRTMKDQRDADQRQLETLSKELAELRQRVDQINQDRETYLREVVALRQSLKAQESRDAALELRLREIEKKLGIENPEP